MTKTIDPNLERSALEFALVGALLAAAVVALLWFFGGGDRAEASPEIAPGACPPGQAKPKFDTGCRTTTPLDFYILQDVSQSSPHGFLSEIREEISKYYVRDDHQDRFSCSGFAGGVTSGKIRAASGESSARCTELNRSIPQERQRSFEFSTDFTQLFTELEETLKAERERDGHGRSGYLGHHRDLIFILSDGVHDSLNQISSRGAADGIQCSDDLEGEALGLRKRSLEALVESFEEFYRTVSQYDNEVWVYLIAAGYQEVCKPGIVADWSELKKLGLNIEFLDSRGQIAPKIARIFERVSRSDFRLQPVPTHEPQQLRAQLDREKWFEATFDIVAINDTEGGIYDSTPVHQALQAQSIQLARATLVRTDAPSPPLALFFQDDQHRHQSSSGAEFERLTGSGRIAFFLDEQRGALSSSGDYQLEIEFTDSSTISAPLFLGQTKTSRVSRRLRSIGMGVWCFLGLLILIWLIQRWKPLPARPKAWLFGAVVSLVHFHLIIRIAEVHLTQNHGSWNFIATFGLVVSIATREGWIERIPQQLVSLASSIPPTPSD